jgi:hypothetical protein
MPAAQSAVLTEFARTCKAAARAVSLYPGTHPAIQSSLARVVAAATRLAGSSGVTLNVHPNLLVIDGRAPIRPDPAIAELADLLHDRLIGALRIAGNAQPADWLALLGLLGRAPEDVIAGGGIIKAWTATGRSGFEIHEIDYAEVLRERSGGGAAEWDRILAYCLQGQSGATVDERAAALLQVLREVTDASRSARQTDDANRTLQAVVEAAAHLTPEMMLTLLGKARAAGSSEERAVATVVERMGDRGIATFVAASVAAERGATGRLAQAFQVLVPDAAQKARLLDLAKAQAERGPLGGESGFEDLWQSAAAMLTSYSDQEYVSTEYDRELSNARAQAIEVDRVSDDPPERVQDWLSTVSDAAIRQLDLVLVLDLLRLEDDPAEWRVVASLAAAEAERRVGLADISAALQLTEAIAGDTGALDRLATPRFVRSLVAHLRKEEEKDVEPLNRLVQAVGPRMARSLAEALASEQHDRAILRLRELLVGFGAAGRQSVEQLKSSSNPAVRRMAVDLLRVFGGREALPELASMLDDTDPQVEREAIRAIVQIGTNEAYAVLERALVADSASRQTVLQELIGLRDNKAIPLLCYVLKHSPARGKLIDVHKQIIEALGGLSPHPESTRTLRHVLYGGDWWAPFRTAALRRAAAAALRRIGSRETLAVLDEAATRGRRGVRNAARTQAGMALRRERARS